MNSIILLASMLAVAYSAPASGRELFAKIANEYSDLLPDDVINTLKTATPEQKEALEKVFRNFLHYKDEHEMIQVLREASPELGERAEQFYEKMNAKIEKLDEEPKGFVKDLVQNTRAMHAKYASGDDIDVDEVEELVQEQIKAFKALSPEAQEALRNEFPKTTALLESGKITDLVVEMAKVEKKVADN